MSKLGLSRSRRREFTNPAVTTNTYAGNLALPFMTPALKANATVANNFVTVLDGIHYKAVLPTETAASDIVQANACAYTDGDSFTLDETTITLDELMVNETICRNQVYQTWHGAATSMVNSDYMSQEFINFTMGLTAAKVAESNENAIWKGSSHTKGFLSDDGVFDATGFAAGALASANTASISAITNANAIAQFNAVYNDAIANNSAVFSKPDIAFYVSTKTYALYTQQLAGLGASISSTITSNDVVATQTGVGQDICRAPAGALQISNLVFATNLGTDLSTASYIPAYLYDGSDNVKIVMRFAWGVGSSVVSDVTVGKTF